MYINVYLIKTQYNLYHSEPLVDEGYPIRYFGDHISMPDEPLLTNDPNPITVRDVQNQIADAILLIGVIVGIAGMVLIWGLNPSWGAEMIGFGILTMVLTITGIARKSVSYRIKTGIVIVTVYSAGVLNLISWGVVGAASLWFVLTVLLSMIFHNLRVGLIVYGIVAITLAVISTLFQLDMLLFVSDLEMYLTSTSWWFARILMTLIVCAMIVVIIGRVITVLQSQLGQSRRIGGELEQRTQDLVDEVQKRKQAEQALADVIVELQTLDSLKDNFIDGVSHELRTPLANIQLYHQLLGMKPDKMQSYLPTLTKETERLSHIVEQMLYASTDYDNLQMMTMVDIDLLKLVHKQMDENEERIAEKNLIVDLPPIDKQYITLAAPEHIYRAVNNVVDNAIKYTPTGGQISVSIKEQISDSQRMISLSVANTGECPSDDERKLLFERFYRGKSSLNMGVAGAGLGLPITQQILAQYGGSIGFHCTDNMIKFTIQMESVVPMEQLLTDDSKLPSSSD